MPEADVPATHETGVAGRTVVLAGASSALGARLAQVIGGAGACVVAVARREMPDLEALPGVTTLLTDLTDADAVAAVVEAHLAAALPHLADDYMGEHWLATFALLALTD